MRFNAEQRARAKFAENLQAEVLDCFAGQLVLERLGPLTGELTDIVASMYVPNIKNSTVIAPRKYRDTDAVPMLVMDEDEELSVDEALLGFSIRQKRGLVATFEGWT
jgi:hypothetical protein